jgi:recombination protein RecA
MNTAVTTANSEKAKALQAALAQIEKQFGKGAVMRMGEGDAIARTIPGRLHRLAGSGHRAGHWRPAPKGRIVEIYGPESSGKTTLTLSVIAEAQKLGPPAPSSMPSTHSTPDYAGKLGVNVNDLLVSQPDTGEQALEITDMLVRSNAVDVIVVDSVAALVPRAEIEGEMGDHARGSAGPSDEPGAAQNDRQHQERQLPGDLHQPDPHEDRRDVRQPGNHHRW